MAFYDTADAVYGVGTYGSASYGRVTPIIQVTGVSATVNTRTIHLNVFEVDITEPIYNAPSATGSIGGITVHTAAGVSGLSATGSVNTVAENVSKPILSVSGSVSVGTAQPNITEIVSGVSSTGSVNGSGVTLKSINYISVSLDALTLSVGTLEPKPSEPVSSVSATGSVSTVQVNLVEKLASATATGSVGSITVNLKTPLTDTPSTLTIGSIGVGNSATLTGVSSTTEVTANNIHVSERMVSTNLSGNIGSVTTTAVVFDFKAVANQYSRRRTVILPRAA